MFVLDTNHVTELAYRSLAGERLRNRILEAGGTVVTTVVTLEEEFRRLLAKANRARDDGEQILVYQKMIERVNFFSRWVVLPLDVESAEGVRRLRSQGIRIGKQDLRIASITMAHGATLLTRNTVDFVKVPGLRFDNWLD